MRRKLCADRIAFVEQLVDHQDRVRRLVGKAGPRGVGVLGCLKRFFRLGIRIKIFEKPWNRENDLFEVLAAVIDLCLRDAGRQGIRCAFGIDPRKVLTRFLEPLVEPRAHFLGLFHLRFLCAGQRFLHLRNLRHGRCHAAANDCECHDCRFDARCGGSRFHDELIKLRRVRRVRVGCGLRGCAP